MLPETNSSSQLNVFILTDEWLDSNGRNILRFFGTSKEGTVEIIINNNKPVFFVESSVDLKDLTVPYKSKKVDMKNFAGTPVDAVYFNLRKILKQQMLFLAQEILKLMKQILILQEDT